MVGRLNRLRQDMVREDGIALVLAIAVLAFLSAATATAIYMTTASHSTANNSSASQNAYALARAGLDDALGVLTGQIDTDGSIRDGATSPIDPSLLSTPRSVSYASLGGTVTYSGSLNTTSYVWTITSTGSVKQQDTSTPVTRTLTQMATVVGLNQGANGGSWSRFYQDDADPNDCLTLDATSWVTNIGTRGCLVLQNGATITGSTVNVDVGTTVTINGVATNTGTKSPASATGWTSSSNVYSNNSVYATYATPINNGAGTNLDVTNFNLGIPTGASITGITASVYRYAAAVNEVQTITQSGSAPSGATFTISVCSGHTSSIAYNASASTVASAINGVCGSSAVACTGGALHSATVTCTFASTSSQSQMSTYSYSSGWNSNRPTYATLQDGGNVTVKDTAVQLLKGGAATGTNEANSSAWPTSKGAQTYGSTTDLWGTTWTSSDVDASNFGVRISTTNSSPYTAATAYVDYISIKVYYTQLPTAGIGSASTPVNELNVGDTCQLNSNPAHSPCSPADYTWASNITTTAAADNPTLVMPEVDFSYWYNNAKPGPKHFCTNPNPGITSSFFDNNSKFDGSITVNGEMAGNTSADPQHFSNWTYDTTTPNIDYDCEVWSGGGTSGTLLGKISWNHTTHVMDIYGTVFIDGAFRFDNDGQVIHYFGRGDLMSSREDEIDSVVCAGWTPGSGNANTTDLSHSCLTNMSNWDPTTNMMVLMADTAASWNSSDQCGNVGEFPTIHGGCEEYDQGGSTCSGNTHPTCYDGYRPSGFQGILWSNDDCVIHQEFQDSGPVICNRILVPNGENGVPTFYTFPYTGNLTDGQAYSDTATSNFFEVVPGQVDG